MSRSMVITLGHNSSAIVVENGNILGGYEEERFSGMKSDSSFPHKSIQRLTELYGSTYDDVCVGHWFTAGVLGNFKYVDMDALNRLSGGNVNSIMVGLTHHDSHLLSAQVFAEHYGFPDNYVAIVADGFGTYGECITVYSRDSGKTQVLNRFFGYENSLGMLYQYATAYLAMKMHNHEYKMLGYEAHIAEVLDLESISRLNYIINEDGDKRVKRLFSDSIGRDTDPVVNTGALALTQHSIANLLDSVLERLGWVGRLDQKRVIISYYVQSIVELTMSAIVKLYSPRNLLVSGGLFYNVKLNHLLANRVKQFCVMPIAGDQGAGLGVYQGVHGDLKWPGHVYWGHRDLSVKMDSKNLIQTDDVAVANAVLATELETNEMVNIVRGSMEFGPRSLCNTATLACPRMPIVEKINEMNDRTTIMPMAPAMTKSQAKQILVDTDKIVGSLDYMIATRDVKEDHVMRILGASHRYQIENRTTCRPQIVNDSDLMMTNLLHEFGPLINTSFNYHGVPIAFEADSIVYSHEMQNKSAPIVTVVLSQGV